MTIDLRGYRDYDQMTDPLIQYKREGFDHLSYEDINTDMYNKLIEFVHSNAYFGSDSTIILFLNKNPYFLAYYNFAYFKDYSYKSLFLTINRCLSKVELLTIYRLLRTNTEVLSFIILVYVYNLGVLQINRFQHSHIDFENKWFITRHGGSKKIYFYFPILGDLFRRNQREDGEKFFKHSFWHLDKISKLIFEKVLPQYSERFTIENIKASASYFGLFTSNIYEFHRSKEGLEKQFESMLK